MKLEDMPIKQRRFSEAGGTIREIEIMTPEHVAMRGYRAELHGFHSDEVLKYWAIDGVLKQIDSARLRMELKMLDKIV